MPAGQFPPGLSEGLRCELASLGADVIAAIAREVPAYARPLEGSFGRGVQVGVREALNRFLSVVDSGPSGRFGPPDLAGSREVYVQLGRGEFRAGRSLDNLLSAYRVGARVSWRRLAEAAQRAGLDATGIVALAETMFAYIDGISGASAEGYATEQFAAAGERERLRDRLGEMLLTGADPDTVTLTAQAASIKLPARLAAVVAPSDANRLLAERLPSDTPRTIQGETVWAFVAGLDSPARQARVRTELAGLGAVVGPSVAWTDAVNSADRARFAARCREAGRLPSPAADADPLFTDDHLCALLLATDPDLLTDLARRRLAPLEGLPERGRERLAETLLHWLALRGQRSLVAGYLHVHPQTVRYRVNQLRELFGPGLEDPDTRFELELVLRASPAARGLTAVAPPPET